MKGFEKIVRVLVLSILVCMAVLTGSSLRKANREYHQMNHQLQDLQAKHTEIAEEFLTKQAYMRKLLTDQAFMQQIIREKEGYIGSKESIFKFED